MTDSPQAGRPGRIEKPAGVRRRAHGMADYEDACARFSWEAVRSEWLGRRDTRLNMAVEAVDRPALGPHADRVAFRYLSSARPGPFDVTRRELRDDTARFAAALRSLGVQPGERVFALLPRIPALHVAALGAVRSGCVFCPLFSAFGPEPIRTRLEIGEARVLVTTPDLYRKKVATLRSGLPRLEHVLVTGGEAPGGTLDLASLMSSPGASGDVAATTTDDPALLHVTRGTPGRPKGALHVHGAILAHHVTGRLALDLEPGDVYWCTADPGWVTGTSYGIIAPLTNGVTSIVDEDEFDPRRWYRILESEHVNVWYTAPTAVRMLMRAGTDLARAHDLSSLRFVASVGEPLHAEAVAWGQEALGVPIHDNWWQTETGGIMIANYACMDIKPGSMGRPLPGVEAALVRRDEDGVHVVTEPDVAGELALRPGWPSMFRAYVGEPERYARCFSGGWYLSGDLARRDADGYYWFVGRADDLIKTSGHLVGPFEVESALMEHPAVAEAAAIGRPDPVAHEIVKAFVVLRADREPSDALRLDILGFARRKLGAAIAPKEVAFVADLPRTRSGKILRRLVRARDLGLPEGDTSTLEATP